MPFDGPEQSSALGKYDHRTGRLEPLLKLPKDIWGINPLNLEQKCALDLLLRDDVKLVSLVGQAGTGKTLLALASGLRKVFDEALYTRILVSRPIVPLGKDIGIFPALKRRNSITGCSRFMIILNFFAIQVREEIVDRMRRSGSWKVRKLKWKLLPIFERSLPKMFFIIDEAQNLTPHEVKTIISRAGQGTKVTLTGDPTQIDNPYLDKDSNGLTFVVSKFKQHSIFGHMFLERTERSELAALAAEIL